MSDEKDDLNIPRGPTIYEKIQNRKEVLDTNDLDRVAKFLDDFNPKDAKYRKTLEAQGYVAARRATTGNYSQIASSLGLRYQEFKYYLDTRPEFAAAIRKGILDSKEELKETLIHKLIKKATGYTVENTEITDSYAYDKDGEQIQVGTKVKKTKMEVPPDPQATIKLLEQLDPSWKQRNQVDVNMNIGANLDVTENVMTAIDLTMLSPAALEEILLSQKAESKNMLANRREDGTSIKHLPEAIDVVEVKEKPKRTMSEETKEKIRNTHKKRAEIKKAKQRELEKDLRVEDIQNGE